jgi:phosphatidylglycerophosphatase GEP4
MGQSFNPAALSAMGRVVLKPGLALPHLTVPHIGYIDFKKLEGLGVRGIVFDKDNTLTAPYAEMPHPLVAEALDECIKQFGRSRVCIMSNSAGTPDDPGFKDADRIEKNLGLPVVRHRQKKPEGLEDVLRYFGDDVEPSQLCVVGDRLLTDMVFGNLHGMLTVHTHPLTLVRDNKVAAVARWIETHIWGFLRGVAGVRPPSHVLAIDIHRILR